MWPSKTKTAMMKWMNLMLFLDPYIIHSPLVSCSHSIHIWHNLNLIFVRSAFDSYSATRSPSLCLSNLCMCFREKSRRRTWSILFRAMRKIQCTCYGITWSITWRFIRFVWAKVFIEDSPNDSNTTCKYTITQIKSKPNQTKK